MHALIVVEDACAIVATSSMRLAPTTMVRAGVAPGKGGKGGRAGWGVYIV
jgi:hypothetical protein